MNLERLAIPSASPHGSGTSEQTPKPLARISPIIPVHLSLESALRSSCVEPLYPVNFLVIAVVALILTTIVIPVRPFDRLFSFSELWIVVVVGYSLLIVSFSTLWRLLFSLHFKIEIRQDGVCTHYRKRDVLLSWDKISLVLHFNGDTWVICSDKGCLIPRESFASREQSRQLARFVRQLWESDGAAWNTTFGLTNSDESQ